MLHGSFRLLAVILLTLVSFGTARISFPQENKLGIVVALIYSPDERFLAAGDMQHNLALYDTASLSLVRGFDLRKLQYPALTIAFAPDGKRLAVVTAATLHWFDSASGLALRSFPISTTAAALSANATRLAVRDGDNVLVLATETGKPVMNVPTGLGFPQALALSGDGRFLATGAQETMITLGEARPHGVRSGELKIFEVPSGKTRVLKSLSPWFSAIAFSPDGNRVAAISYDHHEAEPVNAYRNTVLNVWSLSDGESLLETPLPDDTSRYSYLAFMGHSPMIVATSGASWGGDIALIDSFVGKISHAALSNAAIFSAALAPSGKAVALGTIGNIQVRSLPSRELLAETSKRHG